VRGAQGLAVALHQLADPRLGRFQQLAGEHLLERDEDGRVAGHPQLGAQAVLAARLGDVAVERLQLLAADLRLVLLADLGDIYTQVPDVEVGHRRQPAHDLAILACSAEDDVAPLRAVEATVAARDLEAGGQSFQVPFPRTREGLVEVVDVDHQVPAWGGVGAEVGEVGVPARLHPEIGAWRGGEVGGHDRRRAAVEGERRGEHAAVAKRDQIGHPIRGLAFEHLDRIWTVRRRLPVAVARAGRAFARRLADSRTFPS